MSRDRQKTRACRRPRGIHNQSIDQAGPVDACTDTDWRGTGIFGYLYWSVFIIYSAPLILLIFRVGG